MSNISGNIEREQTLNGTIYVGSGDSAYQVAVNNGFVGTEKEWLASLQGQDGQDGKDGKDGKDGYTPKKGLDYFTEEDKNKTVQEIETDIQPILNDIDEISDNALEIAKNAENIAKGKSSSVVKDTWFEMEKWLKDVANKGIHEIGDNLYIKQVWIDEEKGIRQPDYWITEVLQEPNELGYYYNISVLGTEHPDLTDFLEKDEIKEKYLLITYEDGTTETVKLVVYK